MDKIKVYPDWVCATCIRERGARIPEYHQPTWHMDKCGLCGIEDWVTEPRDAGKTRHLLDIRGD